MKLVEKHKIKNSHKHFKEIDELSFLVKNLYNKANYIIRQEFISSSKDKSKGLVENANWIRYHQLNSMLINDENYVLLPRKVSQQVLMLLDKNWKSFFKTIKDWKKFPEKYKGQPSLPKYKHKTKGRGLIIYTSQAIYQRSLKKGFIKLSNTNIEIPFINKEHKVHQVRVVPKLNSYNIEIIYEKNINDLKLNKNKILSVDLGVNNLMTITSNQKGVSPILIKGGLLKSINHYYNKKLSKFKSKLPKEVKTSKKIRKLNEKRNDKINHWMHVYSKMFVNYCIKNNFGKVVIGYNQNWKQEINIGKKNNQNFVQIPFGRLNKMIEYKCELVGIELIYQEESYTSKASFLDMDKIPIYNKSKNNVEFSGYREHRGMYKIRNSNIRINSDVNGSYNILRKAIPNAFADGIQGFVVNPVIMALPYANC
jgi:IS605 OrfB family transposase